MYLIPILSIAVQAGLIVHVIKTGRNMLWIWAIALLPLVGSIAYVVVEVLPQALGGRTAGIFEHDPTLLLGMARAQFAKQDYAAARVTLERLAHQNPDFKSADADLLYARTLEAQEALDEAERVYTSLAPRRAQAEWLERARRELS